MIFYFNSCVSPGEEPEEWQKLNYAAVLLLIGFELLFRDARPNTQTPEMSAFGEVPATSAGVMIKAK